MAFPFPKNQELVKGILRDWIFSSSWLLEHGHLERARVEYREAIEITLLLPGGSYTEELKMLETLFERLNDLYS